MDNDGNNVMHDFAYVTSISVSIRFKKGNSSNGKGICMITILCFHIPIQSFSFYLSKSSFDYKKEMEKRFPYALTNVRNLKGKTPYEVFYEHKLLAKEIKESAKRIIDFGMIVSALICIVTFVAALTTLDNNNNH